MRKILLIIVVLLTTAHTLDAAAAIAVKDLTNLRRQILNYAKMIEQINNQQQQIEQLGDVINLADRQLNAITGPRGVSALLNNSAFKEARRHLPYDTQEILINLAAGQVPDTASGIRDGLIALLALYDLINDPDTLTYAERHQQLEHAKQESLAVDSLAVVTADKAVEMGRQNISNIEAMIAEIDNTADLKHSIDLNSRIQAEAAMITNQLLHITSLQLRREASQSIQLQKNIHLSHIESLRREP